MASGTGESSPRKAERARAHCAARYLISPSSVPFTRSTAGPSARCCSPAIQHSRCLFACSTARERKPGGRPTTFESAYLGEAVRRTVSVNEDEFKNVA
jgi:hypothetical protein